MPATPYPGIITHALALQAHAPLRSFDPAHVPGGLYDTAFAVTNGLLAHARDQASPPFRHFHDLARYNYGNPSVLPANREQLAASMPAGIRRLASDFPPFEVRHLPNHTICLTAEVGRTQLTFYWSIDYLAWCNGQAGATPYLVFRPLSGRSLACHQQALSENPSRRRGLPDRKRALPLWHVRINEAVRRLHAQGLPRRGEVFDLQDVVRAAGDVGPELLRLRCPLKLLRSAALNRVEAVLDDASLLGYPWLTGADRLVYYSPEDDLARAV